MFEDNAVHIIPAKQVKDVHMDQPFASGRLGAVYKVKHPFVSYM